MRCFFLVFLPEILLTSCQGQPEGPDLPEGPINQVVQGQFTVVAWNDLGMHCLNPIYDKGVVLPPYNTLWAQVIERGDPPKIVTSGITVSYRIEGNTTSSNKRSYGGFWTNMLALFGVTKANDVGLKDKGLSGALDLAASGDHFVAEGIPVVPVNDSGVWDPYQVAVVTVKNTIGATLVETRTTIPTSDEMNCAKCHTTQDPANAFQDMLIIHDANQGTLLAAPGSQPFTCSSASCHGDPALGITSTGSYLSYAVHHKHSTVANPPACYDCHPGLVTKCTRSIAHTAADGKCTTCHGALATMASSIDPGGRTPWAVEPECATCHTVTTGVNTYTTLYRNAKGHGDLYCIACHGSPHAMIPSSKGSDNYQALQYQGFTGKVKSLGSCGVCHGDSRGESDMGEFAEVHGGNNPEQPNGCSACHTAIPANTASWPHGYTWQNSN